MVGFFILGTWWGWYIFILSNWLQFLTWLFGKTMWMWIFSYIFWFSWKHSEVNLWCISSLTWKPCVFLLLTQQPGVDSRHSRFGGCWVMWRCWILWSKVIWGRWRNVVAIVVWWCYFRLWGAVVGCCWKVLHMKMGWMDGWMKDVGVVFLGEEWNQIKKTNPPNRIKEDTPNIRIQSHVVRIQSPQTDLNKSVDPPKNLTVCEEMGHKDCPTKRMADGLPLPGSRPPGSSTGRLDSHRDAYEPVPVWGRLQDKPLYKHLY